MKHFTSINFLLLLFMFTLQAQEEIKIVPNNSSAMHIGYNNCDMQSNGELLIINHCIKEHDTIFDIGANVGEWSAHVLEHITPSALYAFEPQPEVYSKLKNRFERYNYIYPYNYAMGEKNGIITFFCYKNNELSGFFTRKVIKEQPYKTEVTTICLDNFCTQNNIQTIDFLKIDTEGAELSVLQGAQKLLANHAIKTMQFEYGGCAIDAKITLKEIYTMLSNYGYQIFRITPNFLIEISSWSDQLENYQYCNYLATCN